MRIDLFFFSAFLIMFWSRGNMSFSPFSYTAVAASRPGRGVAPGLGRCRKAGRKGLEKPLI